MIYIKNAKVVLETGILWDGAILVKDNKIKAVGEQCDVPCPENAEVIDAKGLYVGPGFVDIHVHGGGITEFDKEPASPCKFHLEHGTTTMLATFYTDLNKEQLLDAIDRVKDVMENEDYGKALGGFYMEAPYTNPKFGSHPESNCWRGEIKAEDYIDFVDRAGDAVKVWAIAPERDGLEPFLKYAKKVNPNVCFAVAHSEATPEQILPLKKYGIKLQTHCMNATGRTSDWVGTRGAGPDEYCMSDPDMYAELICDSLAIHVNAPLQRMLVHVKGIDKMVLISDSTVSNFPTPEEFKHITDLSFDANKLLAGSKLTLDIACRNFMKHTNSGIAQAFLAASTNPAKAIGMDDEVGSVCVGKKANLVFVDDMINVKSVMLEGKIR